MCVCVCVRKRDIFERSLTGGSLCNAVWWAWTLRRSELEKLKQAEWRESQSVDVCVCVFSWNRGHTESVWGCSWLWSGCIVRPLFFSEFSWSHKQPFFFLLPVNQQNTQKHRDTCTLDSWYFQISVFLMVVQWVRGGSLEQKSGLLRCFSKANLFFPPSYSFSTIEWLPPPSVASFQFSGHPSQWMFLILEKIA